MKVRAKSIDRVGEYVAFQYVQLPQIGIEKGQLVQRLGPPTPMVLIAFKDQFAIGPITDLEPVWTDKKIDKVADIAEREEAAMEAGQAQGGSGLVLPEGIAAPTTKVEIDPAERLKARGAKAKTGEEQPSANIDNGEGTTE